MLSVSSAQACCTTRAQCRQKWHSEQQLLLRSCRRPSAVLLWKRRPSVTVACSGSPVPYIPCDDQAAIAYAAISSADTDDAADSSTDKHASSSQPPSNGSPSPEKQPRIPHRWRVVFMMAVAFVLCNMDKVCLLYMISHGWQCTVQPSSPDLCHLKSIYL